MGNRGLTNPAAGIARLAAADLDSAELRQSVVAQLRSAVGFDAWCFALVDPLNRVSTHSVATDAPGLGDRQRRFFQILYDDDCVAKVLASTLSARVSVLSAATDGDLTRSTLWREVHRPSGLGDALFAGVADRGTYWGHLSLYRHADAPTFTVSDAARVHAALAPLGAALRRACLRPVDVMPFVDDAPGTLLLDADLRILGATPMAARWVRDQVPEDAPVQVPAVVAALIAETDASAESAIERRPRVRMRAPTGNGWLSRSPGSTDTPPARSWSPSNGRVRRRFCRSSSRRTGCPVEKGDSSSWCSVACRPPRSQTRCSSRATPSRTTSSRCSARSACPAGGSWPASYSARSQGLAPLWPGQGTDWEPPDVGGVIRSSAQGRTGKEKQA